MTVLLRSPRPFATRLAAAAAAAFALGAAQPAFAADSSMTGNFLQDDQVRMFNLVLSDAGAVTVTSIGYAGGTDFSGNPVAAGGFDTVLYLYSSLGALLYQSDDGVDAPTDPSTGQALDASFTTNVLDAGIYTLALTQVDNYALGFSLSDGFEQAGKGNFTQAFGCSNGKFCDIQGNNRSSSWTLNFSGETLAPVPEPGSLALFAFGSAMIALRLSRRPKPDGVRRPVPAAA